MKHVDSLENLAARLFCTTEVSNGDSSGAEDVLAETEVGLALLHVGLVDADGVGPYGREDLAVAEVADVGESRVDRFRDDETPAVAVHQLGLFTVVGDARQGLVGDLLGVGVEHDGLEGLIIVDGGEDEKKTDHLGETDGAILEPGDLSDLTARVGIEGVTDGDTQVGVELENLVPLKTRVPSRGAHQGVLTALVQPRRGG